MKEAVKKYYFGNAEFTAILKKGVICSLQRTGDSLKTQYVDSLCGFGGVYLVYKNAEGECIEFCPNESEALEEKPPVWESGYLTYRAGASDKSMEAQTVYCLKNGRLEQTVTVKNISDRTLSLTDLGLELVGSFEAKWGESSAPNVMGHQFVGGNGSHCAFYRVDGNGPCLIFAPIGDTALTYYDTDPWLDRKEVRRDGPQRSRKMLYPFACVRGARAESKGAKLRIPQQPRVLEAGESASFAFCYFWAPHYLKAPEEMVKQGLVYPISAPGYTVPIETAVQLCLESRWDDLTVCAEGGSAAAVRKEGNRIFYELRFKTLGEHTVTVSYGNGRFMHLYYFATESVETLWKKRAAFIAKHQVKDDSLWYNGLLCEWNNETGTMLSPDNYDKIGGWRIYEVTCDDPGLAKPAFLSTKQTVLPKQEEITALDDYIEHFVWGGLQQTEEEPYPYAIYGIPDWKKLRDSKDEGPRGKLHIWRVYDYPHILLMYYNMYRVARDYPQMKTRLSKETYLKRAYGTACALFTVPDQIDGWSAYKTGFYNERAIPWIISALRECGKEFEAGRLETFWMRKVTFFVTECEDVFGSEYPFDTTGFESTFYLAEEGLKHASFEKNDSPFSQEIPYEKAVGFMERQHGCNVACRGYLEPAYFNYGSDYRGNNTHYLLSYMSQMGGCSILEHALYLEDEPWEMLRLGYGSLLSSYALMNTGTEESGYGYWFPGKEHDGAAGGGFEPLYEGETWLNQPHHGGSWYYSCEIDLGFCGGVRGAALIAAKDPLFGWIAYGGQLKKQGERDDVLTISGEDGAGRKFHYLEGKKRFHAILDSGRFEAQRTAVIDRKNGTITLYFDPESSKTERRIHISSKEMGRCEAEGELILAAGQTELVMQYQPE